jgi:hypothetical protein
MLLIMQKKTNQPKETMTKKELTLEVKEVNRQVGIIKNDLVNSIDRLFYDIENIEDQAKIFRTIVSQFSNYDLTSIKQYIKLSK